MLRATLQSQIDGYLQFAPDIEDPLELAVARSKFGFRTLLANPAACRLLIDAGPATHGGAVDQGLRISMGKELRDAVALGHFADLDPELVYTAYFGVVTQTIGHLLEQGDRLDPDAGAEQVTRLCFAVLGLPYPDGEGGEAMEAQV